MNKLGFAIKLASQGAYNVVECNKGPWTSKVIDVREYMNLFTGLEGTDNIVSFMSFDAGGCFIGQLRAMPNRTEDHLCGWIYIPNSIDITDAEIINAYNYVHGILGLFNLEKVKSEISTLFSREYPSVGNAPKYVPSHGDKFGVRFLGLHNLNEIIGTNRYQPVYSNYKAVFLMNQNDEVKISPDKAKRFENLSNIPIYSRCNILPPPAAEIERFGKDTRILCEDGSEFKSAIWVPIGDRKLFYIERSGFDRIPVLVVARKGNQSLSLNDVVPIWRKKIELSMFNVADQNGTEIKDAISIKVNGMQLTSNPIMLTEEECKHASVTIASREYETFNKNLDLTIGSGPITVHLTKKTQSQFYRIILSDGTVADLVLKSAKLPEKSDKSPIAAHEFVTNNPTLLQFSKDFVWKQRLLGFTAALLIVLAAYLLVHFIGGNQNEPIETPEDTLTEMTEETPRTDDEAALNYLNTHEQWNKDSLELYPLTQGLYDKINNYEFNELTNIDIQGCDKIDQIKETAKEAYIANAKMIRDSYSNDGSITVLMWIKEVSRRINDEADRSINTPKTPAPSSSQKIKNNNADANTSASSRAKKEAEAKQKAEAKKKAAPEAGTSDL